MAMPNVTYERLAPSPKLSLYVEHFWTVSAPGEQTPRREILIPNGRPTLLLSFANPSVRIDPRTGNRLPNSNMLFGIASQPFVIEQFGESRYIGVQFRPDGLAAFLRGDKLINRALSIDAWLGESGANALDSALLAHDFGLFIESAYPTPIALVRRITRCLLVTHRRQSSLAAPCARRRWRPKGFFPGLPFTFLFR